MQTLGEYSKSIKKTATEVGALFIFRIDFIIA